MSASDPADETVDEWMLKPCELYKNEYDHCTSIRSRIEQYYVFGRSIDCSQWMKDYKNCFLWQKYQSKEAYEELIKSEKARRKERLDAHHANDVWERRDKPPENWNKPLMPPGESTATGKSKQGTVVI